MAVEIVERKLDDVYRKKGIRREADVTTLFSYKGRDFEIDLTKANEADFDDAIQPFLEAAREVTGRRKGGTTKKSAVPVAATVTPKKKAATKSGTPATEADAIREWARRQGIQVSDRGRIADSVKASYYAGHPKPESIPSTNSEERPSASPQPSPEVEEVEEVETEVDGFEGLYEDEDPYAQI